MAVLLFSGTIWSLVFWFLSSLAGIYVLTYYLVYLRQIKRWEQSKIPYLRPTFFIGHKYLLNLSKYSISVPVDQIYKEKNDEGVIAFFLGVLPVILVKDPKLFQNVFSRNIDSPQMNITSWLKREGGEVMPQRDEWRRIMKPFFSVNWYEGSRFESIKKEINALRHTAEKIEIDGSSIDVVEVTVRVMKNIAGSNFGIDHSGEMKNRLWRIVEDFFEASPRRSIMFFCCFLFPSLQVFDFFNFWSSKSCNTMSEIIKHQIHLRDQNNTEPRDLIDILQLLRKKEEPNNIYHTDSDVSSIGRGILAKMSAIGLPTLIVGSDGVQRLFAFTIHTLSLHPDYQGKIRSEIHEALKKYDVSELNFDVVRSLTFLNDCLKGYTQGMFTIAALVASLLQKYEIKPRSHLKLMDSTDFLPQAFVTQPRRDLLVDLVRRKNLDDA